MAKTNFAALTAEEKTLWSMDFWREARNMSFMNAFTGKGENAMIQRVTELKSSEKGARAVITLINEMTSDGVTGDNDLVGNEEALSSSEIVIRLDQLRNANRNTGRMSDQKTIVNFREQSRDKLAYWCGDRLDQMAFLTLSGIAYTQTNKGAARPVLAAGLNLNDLEFAADVTAPTANRHIRWNAATGDIDSGDTAAVTAADTLTYKALVRAKAYAKDHYVRGIRGKGNQELYHVFVTPSGMADLRLDDDFLTNVRQAMPRSSSNPLHAGAESVLVDGMMVHEFRHVYNNVNAGTKWGAGGDVDGQRVLICGAQALAFADIGKPIWEEEDFDYKNQIGISAGKIIGYRKPKFHSTADAGTEDFGVICLDTAL